MALIKREAVLDYMNGWKGDTVEFVRSLPAVEAVPIEQLSAWLAAYAMPPKYALEAIGAPSIASPYQRIEAWEYHWKHMMEEDSYAGTDKAGI